MNNIYFTLGQVIIIGIVSLFLLTISIVIGIIAYQRRVKELLYFQGKLLGQYKELESQTKKNYIPTTEFEDKVWHEAETGFIFQLHEKIAGTLVKESVVEDIIEGVHNFLNVKQTILLLPDKNTNELKIASAIGVDKNIIEQISLKNGESISGHIISKGSVLEVEDLEKDDYLKKINKESYLSGNFIGIPIIFKNNILGVLNVCNKKNAKLFSKRDVALLTNVGKVAAVTLQNISFYEEINDNYLKTIAALASAIDARDPYTKYHSENVTRYSLAMANQMQLNYHDKEVLIRAALLHDIGKIGVRDNVLLKNGKLTDEEFAQIKTHSPKGEEIIKSLPFLKETAVLIRHHHERYDGKGYPDGIRADTIELGSRIIAVADTFDAMTTDRPYRKRLSVEEAVKELERSKGTQLDPEIVTLFIKTLKENPGITQTQNT